MGEVSGGGGGREDGRVAPHRTACLWQRRPIAEHCRGGMLCSGSRAPESPPGPGCRSSS
jgi:hypothetical protein